MPALRPCGFAFAIALALAASSPAFAQTPDQQAEMLLGAARKAYNDGNPQFAAEKFREFLQKFGGHKDANAARYGLGLAILDLPDRNYPQAIEALGPPAGDANFPDRPLAVYYLAVAHRGQGLKELAEGVAKPNEMPQRQQAATGRFTEAAKFFAQARELFEKKNPPDGEWAARCRCDTAEMELRTNKLKEARATAEPFAKDAAFAKSKFRPLGLYYHGVACFLLNDIPAAGKSLNQLAPFDQPFGPHAHYLMGRVHMAQGENPEAAAAFDAVLAVYDKQKKDATELLKQPDRFKNDPWEKARLEALVKGPAPDYVAGSAFYGACLNYETGRFGEALPKFQAFARDYAASPLKDDALLRAGFCFVQTKQYDEAVKTLQPLTNVPRLADQAFYWIGKAQMGQAAAADPNNPNARNQIIGNAINSFKTAADRANQLAGQGDPDAKSRRAEILLDLADAHQAAKQAREAAQVYEAVWNEKLLPNRQEEILLRLIDAYHLAGDLAASEARVTEFKQKFPNSPLLPAALFRSAENAYARGRLLIQQNKPGEAKLAFAEAGKKYEEVVAKFPEFDRVSRARFGQALCLVAAEEWEKAAAVLEAIPGPDRNGELYAVPYVLADCHIRTAPAKAEDALQDNILREKLGAAATLLEGFVAANPKSPEAPDALLKIGYCYKRLGAGLPPGNERNDALNKSRAAYEKLTNEYKQAPEFGTAVLERARVLNLQGDKNGAIGTLNGFRNDPLQKSPVAPLAYVTLATLLREQNKAADAVTVLAEGRQKFEGQLTGDPARVEWIALLRYHHGVALFEAGKHGEARTAFDQAVQAAAGKPIGAESALRGCQCQAEEVKAKIAGLEKERQKPNLKPDEIAAIEGKVKAAKTELAGVGKLFERRAEEFRAAQPQSEARARMLYDAAWVYRAAGEDPVPVYTKLIAEFADLSLAVEARLELAEILAEKGKPDDAVKLLKDAIDKEPTDKPTPPETTERIRLRLGATLFAKKDFAAAQGQFDAVAANEKSPHRGQAIYRSAECLMAQKKFEEAKNKLVIFRDNGAFHNVPGVSDRAMLRLGHCLLELKQWDAARQAFDALIGRYGNNNPWAADARYGIGFALQNQGRFDDAVGAYAQVTQTVTDERAGRAQLQIGLCRAAQKRYDEAGKAFAAVYYGYEMPDLKFAALLEHARVLAEQGKNEDAVKLLEKVIKDAPKDSDWTKAATERLGKIKK
ncbi:MAG TPA: tetratricopeptide repeat protein [Gemmataceae bacterium]|nr:tetratricopeptide repeat protein [Gemmataceae bacterium]